MKVVLFSVLVGLAFVSGPSFAQESEKEDRSPAAVDQSTTAEERARVKKRLYPGGRDEDSLQVQEQLPIPSKAGAVEEPADPDDHD